MLHPPNFIHSDPSVDNDLRAHEAEFCSFRELSALVISWNAGAASPSYLRHEKPSNHFFSDVIVSSNFPDILVFGFQELVDLEDKKLTASEPLIIGMENVINI